MPNRILVAALLAFLIGIPLFVQANAQEAQTVSATVSPLAVSLTVNPGSINYGTMAFETSRTSTDSAAGNVTFTATNTGNAAEAFLVRGADANGDGFVWALSDSIGCGPESAKNKFRHSVKVGTSPAFYISTADNYLATGVPALTGTAQFTTEFYMPCAGSGGSGKVATTSITITAISG